MSRIGDYCDRLVLTALASPRIERIETVRHAEDATGQIGFMRYRLTLSNGGLLELTERLEVRAEAIVVTKYRHQMLLTILMCRVFHTTSTMELKIMWWNIRR